MTRKKPWKGFASIDPETRKAIASKGGKSAHRMGRGHEFTPEEASAAGSKGGKEVAKDREHMARIGRMGGRAAQRAAREEKKAKKEKEEG